MSTAVYTNKKLCPPYLPDMEGITAENTQGGFKWQGYGKNCENTWSRI